MNITPSEVYWVMQMDTICEVLFAVSAILAAVSLAAVIVTAVIAEDLRPEDRRRIWKSLAPWLAAAGVSLLALALTPDTKTLAAVKLIPAITNGEAMQKLSVDGKEIYQLGIEKIKQELKGETK